MKPAVGIGSIALLLLLSSCTSPAKDSEATIQNPKGTVGVPDSAVSTSSTTMDPVASDPAYARLYSRTGESPRDFAARFANDVMADPTVVAGGEVVEIANGRLSAVLRSARGSTFVVEMTTATDGRYRFERLASPGLDWRAPDGPAVIPEPGRLTVMGYDGGLNPPGETMTTNLAVNAGSIELRALVESSWLRIDLATPDGRILTYVGRRTRTGQ